MIPDPLRVVMKKRLLLFVYLFISISQIFVIDLSNAETKKLVKVQIGVLAFNGKQQALTRWKPTADYLSQNIPSHQFLIVPLTHDEFSHAINKGQLDFVLTNPGHYVRLEVSFGVTRIATFKTRFNDQVLTRFGSVIFSLKDSDIRQLIDLRSRKLGAVSQQAFGGFQLAQKELLENHLDANIDMNLLWLGFPQTDIVHAVLAGRADAGIVRTGILEKMAERKQIDLSRLHILNQKRDEDFPLMLSTALYPEWPLARLPDTDEKLAKNLAVTLLQMPDNAEPALISEGAGWTIPMDYTAVHDLFRQLQIAPYIPVPMGLIDLWQTYRYWLLLLVFVFLAGLMTILVILTMNKRLKVSERSLSSHQNQLEEAIRLRTQQLSDTNHKLQQDITSRMKSEQTMHDACEVIQALSTLSIRNDLKRQQRLQSMLDLCRQYLAMEIALIWYFDDQEYKSYSTSPVNESVTSPLSETLSHQALVEHQMKIEKNDEQWQLYIACPILMSEHSIILFEFASVRQNNSIAENQNAEPTELSFQILHLITQWMGNEILQIEIEQDFEQKKQQFLQRLESLTPREQQVLKLVVNGESNKTIARILKISPKTVELHRGNLLRKTQSNSSLQLVKLAVQSGMTG